MECFPPSLRHDLRAEDGKPDLKTRANPVYIDLRPPRGGVGATSAEDYRSVLQAQNEYKDSVIESAVQKYSAQLEEARILLVSGALGLSPVELTQRELLRKIEEQKQREIESAERVRAARRRTRMASVAAASAFGSLRFRGRCHGMGAKGEEPGEQGHSSGGRAKAKR